MDLPVPLEILQEDKNGKECDGKLDLKWMQARKKEDLDVRDESIVVSDDLMGPSEQGWNHWTIFYSLLIVMAVSFSSCGVTLVPQHNSIEEPEYWYETIITQCLTYNAYVIVITAMRLKIFFKDDARLGTPIPIITMYLVTLIAFNGVSYLLHLFWTVYLGFNHPIPWLGVLSLTLYFPTYYICLWFQFSPELKSNAQGRRKIFFFCLYSQNFFFACMIRITVMTLFAHTPPDMQPIWAIVMPIIRELDGWMLNYWMLKTTDGENRDAKLVTETEHNCNYMALMAIVLGLWATDTASYCILGVEFLINFCKTIVVLRMNRKISSDPSVQETLDPLQQEAAKDLVFIELVEIMMPFVYTFTVLMAYYGPNGTILGNVRNNCWDYKAIEDLTGLLGAVFRMFSLDVLAFAITVVLLWKYSSVNGIKVVLKEIRYYGTFICVTLSGGVLKVCFAYPDKNTVIQSITT
jgi:hypothetical protein